MDIKTQTYNKTFNQLKGCTNFQLSIPLIICRLLYGANTKNWAFLLSLITYIPSFIICNITPQLIIINVIVHLLFWNLVILKSVDEKYRDEVIIPMIMAIKDLKKLNKK
jgi:hypothetical protein